MWQITLGLTQPSVTQVARFGHTLAYLHQALPALLAESAYRLTVLLEYQKLFLLPLAPCSFRYPEDRSRVTDESAGRRW